MSTSLKDRVSAAAAALTPSGEDGKTNGATGAEGTAADAPRQRAGNRTAPGTLMANITAMQRLDDENAQLRRNLEAWVGAQPTRRLDPSLVDHSVYANRDPSHFQGAAWQAFVALIEASKGNVQAALVRPGNDGRFELVFGHRRHRACLEAGYPLLAVVADQLGDLELFQLMEQENHGREDLSPYEQGVSYAKALDQRLFPSLRQLAAGVGRDPGIVSRYVALARLPAPVLDAFSSRTRIQKRWGETLAALNQKDGEALVAKARHLAESRDRLSDAEVFRRLCETTASPTASVFTVADAAGTRIATARRLGRNKVEVTFAAGEVTDAQIQKLLAGLSRVADPAADASQSK